jgi:orotate phosphoribosyltransferase
MDLEQIRRWIDEDGIFRCSPEDQYQPGIPAGRLRNFAPGKYTTWLFQLRRVTQNPERLKAICDLLLTHILAEVWHGEPWEDPRSAPFQFAGLETASTPMMIGLARAALDRNIVVNTFSVRKERKAYGLFHMIEGIPNEYPAIIVDDSINSGSSIRRCADAIHYELKIDVISKAFAIVRAADMPIRTCVGEIQVFSLFKRSDFNLSFDPAKAWIPLDCQRRGKNRPDH